MASEVYLTDRQVRAHRLLAKISVIGNRKKIFCVCVRETPGNKRFWASGDLEIEFALC